MSWVSDLGLQKPRIPRSRRRIFRAAPEVHEDGCWSRSGVWRPKCSPDKDLRCVFCDQHKQAPK